MTHRLLVVLALLLALPEPLHAEEPAGGPPAGGVAGPGDRVRFQGFLQNDLRYLVEDERGAVPGDGYHFQLNRNDVDLRLKVEPAERVQAVVDARLRFFGFNRAEELPALAEREKIDPYLLRLDEAYVAVRGFVLPKLDLKIGRMTQSWGSADMFNPTDNLSARDFSDPLDYSTKVPNQMVELDLYPTDWLTLTAVWVPVFKPSQLPDSAALGFAVERDARGCLLRAPAPPLRSRADAEALARLFSSLDPCSLVFRDPTVRTVLPGDGIADSQAAARAQLRLGDLDLAFSYYYGRFTFPVAYTALARVNPSTTAPGKIDVDYQAEVMYPRMQVIGADFSYSAEWLFDIGLVGELAVVLPEEVWFGLRADQGETALLKMSSQNVPSDPFLKATLGLDYTFTSWLYVNAMYVRGFFDEFNDRYGIHNYAVAAAELKFFDGEWQLRLSGVLNADDRSAVANPTLTWIVRPSMELTLGAFLFHGRVEPSDPLDYAAKDKFGQKAAGRSVAFLRSKVTW